MKKYTYSLLSAIFLLTACINFAHAQAKKQPVDYVNPYIGNISHLLVPTYPTVHLPNSLLRVYPERDNFTSNTIDGLPVVVTSHRGSSAFNLSPFQGDLKNAGNVISYGYDNEVIKPYYYEVDLDDYGINVQFSPSHQSGIYALNFSQTNVPAYLVLNTRNGALKVRQNVISGFRN